MRIHQLIRESILSQVSLIEEAKDHLIKRIPGLTADQKEQLIEKYQKNPNLERDIVIDWNRLNNLTWEDFEPVMNYVSKTQEKQDIKVSGAEVLFENDKVLVVKPITKDASICYGKGTKWCTAAMTNNMFKSYFSKYNQTLIYVLSKILSPSDPMYKTAIAISDYDDTGILKSQQFDAKDDSIPKDTFFDNVSEHGMSDDQMEEIFIWYEDAEERKIKISEIMESFSSNNGSDLYRLLANNPNSLTQDDVEYLFDTYGHLPVKIREVISAIWKYISKDMIIGNLGYYCSKFSKYEDISYRLLKMFDKYDIYQFTTCKQEINDYMDEILSYRSDFLLSEYSDILKKIFLSHKRSFFKTSVLNRFIKLYKDDADVYDYFS